MGSETPDSNQILSDLVPLTYAATVSAGASAELSDPDIRLKSYASVWDLLHSHVEVVPPPPPPPPPPSLPEQLGPFNWNPIVFGGGVPVGGWAQLTMFRNGAVNYTGHFHVSGVLLATT